MMDEGWDEVWDASDAPKDALDDKIIVHIDIDCFYAQAEMLKNPDLRSKPVAVFQKQLVITTNYVARDMGIPKSGWVGEMKQKYPELKFVNGEDLQDYRRFSLNIFKFLQKLQCPVERLGMDENFIDVTKLARDKVRHGLAPTSPEGQVFGDPPDAFDPLLVAGSLIASQIRKDVLEEFGLTTSAGIAHNKVLAKLVGSKNKPYKQTSLPKSNSGALIGGLKSAKAIPGIGHSTFKLLQQIGVQSVEDLQSLPLENLEGVLGKEGAKRTKDLSLGIDHSQVKMSGQVQTIGLEDRFQPLSKVEEVKEKTKWLLGRLIKLLFEDGRIPQTLKVTARDSIKYNDPKKFFKESRQCKVSSSLFWSLKSSDVLPDTQQEEMLSMCHKLLEKMVDFNRHFELKLLGLAFSDFVDKPGTSKDITTYFKNAGVKRKLPDEGHGQGNVEPKLPRGWDAEVFHSLPKEVQEELLLEQKSVVDSFKARPKNDNSKKNDISRYFLKTNIKK